MPLSGVIQKECEHTSYNLESYEMVERVGWSWMKEDTLEKECDHCQIRKKLSGRNPMYYCRSCHAHGICKCCWSSLLLSDVSTGRGQRKKQCRKESKVIAGNLMETERTEDEEDSIGCISISSRQTEQEMEDDEVKETNQVPKMKCRCIR